jgi:ubiquinone/menaquinone biosynthesis C-methylase UbiE
MNDRSAPPNTPPICDYEGSDYRARFWENANRDYEDLAERIAIRRLLPAPPPGRGRLLEIGTGFGRLVDLYRDYAHVILLDYSKSLLREARQRLGDADPQSGTRYTYVAADIYRLPLRHNLVDTTCMVRVMHHMADVPRALRRIARAIRPGGAFVLEFASKLHVKSVARWLLRRQDWSPFDREPIEFVELNYDFHPRWMRARLEEAGLAVERTRAVSTLRVGLLKQLIPAPILAAADGALQWTGQCCAFAPSVFVRARATGQGPGAAADRAPAEITLDPSALFCCPACEGGPLRDEGALLRCASCGTRWALDDGIYDFKVEAG